MATAVCGLFDYARGGALRSTRFALRLLGASAAVGHCFGFGWTWRLGLLDPEVSGGPELLCGRDPVTGGRTLTPPRFVGAV